MKSRTELEEEQDFEIASMIKKGDVTMLIVI
jgi:hypothetical protein